jgi:hypothetical protein
VKLCEPPRDDDHHYLRASAGAFNWAIGSAHFLGAMAAIDPNWITAVATAVAGLTGSVLAALGWSAFWQVRRDRKPAVEGDCYRPGDGPVTIRLALYNRLNESVDLVEACVLRPRCALITDRQQGPGLQGEWEKAAARCVQLQRRLRMAAVGTLPSRSPTGMVESEGATVRVALNIQFPSGWRSGKLVIALRMESTSWRVRRSSIIVQRRIPLVTASDTDAKANSHT